MHCISLVYKDSLCKSKGKTSIEIISTTTYIYLVLFNSLFSWFNYYYPDESWEVG